MNVEIKTPSDEFIYQFSDLVRKYKMEDYIIWGAVSKKYSQKMGQVNSRILRFANLAIIIQLYLTFMVGLLPFVSLTEFILQIPMYNSNFRKILDKCIGFRCVLCLMRLFDLITAPIIKHLQKRGIYTYLWVINDVAGYERAIGKNCIGIITDRPSLLKEYLMKTNKLLIDK